MEFSEAQKQLPKTLKGGLQIQKKAWMGKVTKNVEWTNNHDTASFLLHWNKDFEYICSRTRYTS